jgi:hypothetical protein
MNGYQTTTGNQLQSAVIDGIKWNYSYDGEGNETKKSQGTNAQTWTYGYDNRNELTVAKEWSADPDAQGSGATVQFEVDYKYDAVGDRIQKKVNGVATDFAYDRGNIWADVTDEQQAPSHYADSPRWTRRQTWRR